ncbi:MAG TPA: MoaD/ThiS family protein [Verrucomicrobiales bacterium]|jgi:molybdopterin converting factor small subunit|nr:MoaD/ThiS family protein [Verrucomicrobiales bacterium]
MKIPVEFYSYFKDITGCTQTEVEVSQNADVSVLMSEIYRHFPELLKMKQSTLVAVDMEYQGPDHPLTPTDKVSLFPPVQGG